MRCFRILLLAALAGSCGDTTNTALSQLNLTRPTDIAFACFGGLRITGGASPGTVNEPIETTAQPLGSCDFRSGAPVNSAAPLPPGQEDLTLQGGLALGPAAYYAFILQPTIGIVSVATWTPKPSTAFTGADVSVIDSDPLTPGTNGITIGENPIGIATDVAGCFEVTANAGSCDLSELQINSALDGNHKTQVNRKDVVNASGAPIRAKPATLVAEPPGGTIGVDCPATATGLMYVAYPSCHMVAVVDVSGAATATIVSTIRYDANGVPSLGDGNITCPDECGTTGTIPAGTRPTSIAIEYDDRVNTRRLAIGAENSSAVTLVELDATDHPLSLSQLALEDSSKDHSLGVIDVTISPQIGMGGETGVINDTTQINSQSQYIYAVATDGSVRVVDILNINKECDTQVDPRFIDTLHDIKKLSCFPVGDPATPPRRATATGPGIVLTGDAKPLSVAVVRADPIAGDTRTSPSGGPIAPAKLIGYFALVTALNGAVYIVNIDDDNFSDSDDKNPIASPIPLDIAHQLRDGIGDRDATSSTIMSVNGVQTAVPLCDITSPDPDSTAGVTAGPRAPTPPTRTVPTGTFAATKVGQLPDLRHVLCIGQDDPNVVVSELDFKAPIPTRALEFPDWRALKNDETWTLTWEGSLSQSLSSSAVDGPAIRTSQLVVDNAAQMRLDDAARPFCSAGAEPFDAVQLRGCDPSVGDADCPIGYTCFVHPESTIVGLGSCMLTTEADRLANACKEFLISLRRYTVAHAATGELVLLPRKLVLRTTPLDGCTSNAQCGELASYALQTLDSTNPEADTTADTHAWSCEVDPDRAPIGGTGKRCVETCATDPDCESGTVCQNGRCMEGVIPPQSCVNAPQRYDIRAHDAFTVIGTVSGYVHPIIADATGKCVTDPTANPWQVGRIPLAAPACDPAQDPLTGKRADGTIDANPCSLMVDTEEVDPTYAAGPGCIVASTALTKRSAPGLRFRNAGLTLTMTDPVYPGDQRCVGDRLGPGGVPLVNVPLTFTGFQLAFRQAAGFAALLAPVSPSLPIRVRRGPGQSIWVMDEGDFRSTDITQPSTRGKVFRMEGNTLTTISTLE